MRKIQGFKLSMECGQRTREFLALKKSPFLWLLVAKNQSQSLVLWLVKLQHRLNSKTGQVSYVKMHCLGESDSEIWRGDPWVDLENFAYPQTIPIDLMRSSLLYPVFQSFLALKPVVSFADIVTLPGNANLLHVPSYLHFFQTHK